MPTTTTTTEPLAFKTVADRAADLYEYLQQNRFTNGPKLLNDGLDRGDGFVLVASEADATAYPTGKAIVHDSPLRLKGKTVTIDTAYAANLMYALAAGAEFTKHTLNAELAALRAENARLLARLTDEASGTDETDPTVA